MTSIPNISHTILNGGSERWLFVAWCLVAFTILLRTLSALGRSPCFFYFTLLAGTVERTFWITLSSMLTWSNVMIKTCNTSRRMSAQRPLDNEFTWQASSISTINKFSYSGNLLPLTLLKTLISGNINSHKYFKCHFRIEIIMIFPFVFNCKNMLSADGAISFRLSTYLYQSKFNDWRKHSSHLRWLYRLIFLLRKLMLPTLMMTKL